MTKQPDFEHKEQPVFSFETEEEFDKWMSKNFDKYSSFWIRYYKKASGIPTLLPSDAVNVLLCYGWIDGLLNTVDDESYVVRMTPRRPKSVWSQVNVAKVAELIESGRMQPSGMAHVEAAKADGRWAAAYTSRKTK